MPRSTKLISGLVGLLLCTLAGVAFGQTTDYTGTGSGGGGSVTWPPSGQAVISTGNDSPSGAAVGNSGANTILKTDGSSHIPQSVVNGLGTMASQNATSVAITGGTITGLSAPTQPLDAATKAYVDAAALNGTFVHSPVAVATSALLPNSPTYVNGSGPPFNSTLTSTTNAALVVDGQTVSVLGTRVLVQNQSSAFQNGIYELSQAGGATPWILTRDTDFNTVASGNIELGAQVFVRTGTLNANAIFWMNQVAAITVGTTAITWAQNGASTQLPSGTGPQMPQYSSGTSSTVTPVTISGDCTIAQGGALTCTKTNGVAFGSFATGSNAANLTGGVVPTANLPVGSSTQLGLLQCGTNTTCVSGVISATGGGSSVTWPSGGSLVVSNGTNTPGGIPVVNGDCVLGSSGAWVAGSCAGSGSWVPPATIDATTASGTSICQKISAAQNTLAATNGSAGGVIYAMHWTSAQGNCSTSMFAGWTSDRNYEVVLGPGKIISDVPQCVPNFDSLLGTTEYPNFGSSAGSVIEASNNYASTSGATHAVTGSSGGTTLSMTSTSGISVGDAATGTNIGPHALVVSIVTNSSVTVTEKNTGAVSTTATFMPALVCMGTSPTVQTFHIHIENIAASCQTPSNTIPAGCIDFQDLYSQEGSYFRNTYAGIAEAQYDLEDIGSVNPQNISPWKNLFAQELVATSGLDLANAVCLRVGNAANLLPVASTIDKLSCAGTAGTSKEMALIDAANVTIKNSHFENSIGGMLIGSERMSHGITVENLTCGTGISTTCIELSAAGGSDGVTVLGLGAAVSTNMLKDDQTGGCTFTPGSVGTAFAGVSYFRGNGSTPVLKGLWSGC